MSKVELLAPAGNFDSLYASINNGCDAVFLGLDDFNARIKADNFTKENIKDVVSYAHLRNVKVYVTVNIIIKDNEYDSLIEMIKKTVESSVDAYLVQDLGVAKVLSKCFPNICLHASTQMGIHNVEGALIAKKEGFSRVVLSRETKLEDIKLIKEQTGLEVEYFVQGALCVSFSGNCYMSGFKTSNSGNRGRCQQLCRLKYQAFEDDKFLNSGYLLSPRDLSLITNLRLLKEAGVDSLKIEGRLRRKGYVATAVKTYRHALDLIEQHKELKGNELNNSIISLRKVFSRGDFNYDAYLKDGVPDHVMNIKNQNHTGIKIGKSISCKQFKNIYEIEVYSTHHINPGDGLKFIKDDKEIVSLGVGNVNYLSTGNYKIYSKNKVPNGLDMYLTLDSALENDSLESIKRMPVEIYCYAYPSSPLVVTLVSNNISVTATSEYIVQEASKAPLTTEDIKKQLDKLNDTCYYASLLEVEHDNCFIPKSVINETRREAIKLLDEAILEAKSHKEVYIDETQIASYKNISNDVSYHKDMFIINENIKVEALKQLDLEDKLIVISPTNIKQTSSYIDYIKANYPSNDIAINLPIIMMHQDKLLMDEVLAKYKPILIANNVSHLCYLTSYKVIAGLGLNICSSYALNYYLSKGCINAILSLEAPASFVRKNSQCYYYTIGYNTLMNFSHCPYKVNYGNTCAKCSYNDKLSYQDEQHNKMKIRRIKLHNCYFELLNSSLINVYNDVDNLKVIDLRNLDNNSLNNLYSSINEGYVGVISIKDSKGLLTKEIK